MTAFRTVPAKKYRLHDGRLGTEYEALQEVIKYKEKKLQEAEDELEELRNRLNLAEGPPNEA